MSIALCDHRSRYEKLGEVGQGTYGVVYKALDKSSKPAKVVAIKKIRVVSAREGVSFTALREIKLLQELRHPNIVDLIDVYSHNQNIHLVMDFMDTDLELVIKDRNLVLTAADIKGYMLQLLRGLEHCHMNWVLHRDLKPSNLLLGSDGSVKLADFGLARMFGSPNREFTHQVVTRWYRAPELLFGAKYYGVGVDMWAVGCIFAELMLRTPYLPGDSDIDQLAKIFAALGTPNEDIWPGLTSLPDYVPFTEFPPTPFKALFTAASDDAIDLLAGFLRYDPNTRLTTSQALSHPYFTNAPSPTPPEMLPRPKPTLKRPADSARTPSP
eukprot:GILK01007533.1.p1 GENE.GILK01007533.1~~GILK01007533.1.p1  ORF type:complete len:326 (-),score=37.14 GILK01007533.1:270-1247(-)